MYLNILFIFLSLISIILIANSSHLFRSDYKWKHNGLYYKFFARGYYRIEYALMKIVFKIGSGWLLQHFRFLRKLLEKLFSFTADGEVYTLDECYKILDSLYKDYPHVYVGMRVCACRQGLNNYSKEISNITDLLFIYSKVPHEKLKKPMAFTKYITLDHAKRLLKKFDNEGFVHTMFGICARYFDGSASVSICNCRSDTCVPMMLALEYDISIFHKAHNLAIINQQKCKGVEECGKCLDYCHFSARIIDPTNGKIKIINDKCTGCALCLSHCPEGANSIRFLPGNRIWYYENLFKNLKSHQKSLPENKRPCRIPPELQYQKK